MGALQSIPSSSIENCSRLNETEPLFPVAYLTPSFKPLGQQTESIAVEPQHLHNIAAPASEDVPDNGCCSS
jgi:hypothetical protein